MSEIWCPSTKSRMVIVNSKKLNSICMRLSKKIYKILSLAVLSSFAISCSNQDVEYPDSEGGTSVYFSYQYPVRTIVLGEDTYDTSLDNKHRCEIYATMGGVYSNKKKINIDFVVADSLCQNLFFEDGNPVVPMPSTYYTLSGNQIVLNKSLMGSVGVQLQDAFFTDPKALSRTYVIPLLMTKVENADRILTGRLLAGGAPRTYKDRWDIQPKDYVLYCLKFINVWDANYLCRGIDQVTENGVTTTNARHAATVEKDEIRKLSTVSLTTVRYPVTATYVTTGSDGKTTTKTLTCDLLLNFDNKNECSITTNTVGFSASGSGKFVEKGEKKSWGNKDRNALYLEYKIDFGVKQYATKDTLVVRDRDISAEWFTPTYKQN